MKFGQLKEYNRNIFLQENKKIISKSFEMPGHCESLNQKNWK